MSKRLDKIRTKWTDERLRRLPGVPDSRQSLNKVFACIVQADPTSQHKMVDWLLTAWENKGFLWEDIRTGSNSKIAQTMSDFERLKSRLTKEDGTPDIPARSLMKYKNPGEVWTRIKPLLELEESLGETQGSRTQKRLDIAKARLETYSVALETGVQMDIPMTQFSAMILGRTTKWCTSADNDNRFLHYAEQGPLMIFTLPDGTRFQAHGVIDEKTDDELDRFNDIDDIEETKNYNSISCRIDEILRAINHIPEEEREGGYDSKAVYYGHIERIAQDMQFLNEADNPPTDEEKVKLAPYISSISEMIIEVFMKSSGLRKTGLGTNITQEHWSRVAQDMSSALSKTFRPDNSMPKFETADVDTGSVDNAQRPSMETTFEHYGLIKKDGDTLSVRSLPNETFQEYYDRYNSVRQELIASVTNEFEPKYGSSKGTSMFTEIAIRTFWLKHSNILMPASWMPEIRHFYKETCKSIGDKEANHKFLVLSGLLSGHNLTQVFPDSDAILEYYSGPKNFTSLTADNAATIVDVLREKKIRDNAFLSMYANTAIRAGHNRDTISQRVYQTYLASKPNSEVGSMIEACGEMLSCMTSHADINPLQYVVPRRCATTESVIDECLDKGGQEKTKEARKEISSAILLNYSGRTENNISLLPKTLGGASLDDRWNDIQNSFIAYIKPDADILPGSEDAINLELFKRLSDSIPSWSYEKLPRPVQEAAYILTHLERDETEDAPRLPRIAGDVQDFYISKLDEDVNKTYPFVKVARASHEVAFPDQKFIDRLKAVQEKLATSSPEATRDINAIMKLSEEASEKETAVTLNILDGLEKSLVIHKYDTWKYGFLRNIGDQDPEDTYSDAPAFQFLAPSPFRSGF